MLVCWLPLTDDLHNQGLVDVTVTNVGATRVANGKIGGCYQFDGSNDQIMLTNLPNPANVSVAFWMKRNANTGTRQFMFTAWSGVSCELLETGAVRCYVSGGGGDCRSTTHLTTDSGWVHVCYTFEDKVGGKLYIDGKQVASSASTGSINWSTTTGRIGYYNTFYNGFMNDFRLYDEVLAPKTIAELAKGLVVHYTLSDAYLEGTTNLLPSNLQNFTETGGDAKAYVVSTSTHGTYTLSGYITSRPTDKTWTSPRVTFRAMYSDGTHTIKQDYNVIKHDGVERRFELTITTDSTKTLNNISGWLLDHSSGTTGKDVTIRCAQLEMKDHATPYTPSARNETTVYDSSGYCHNININGNLTSSGDTPRYTSSLLLDGSVYGYLTNSPAEINTLSVWCKTTKNKSTSQFVCAVNSTKLCISFYQGTIISYFGADSKHGVGSKCTLGSSYIENGWNHIVVVRTGEGTRDVYCNGVKLTPSNNDYWSPAGGFFIGARNTAGAIPFYGYISDVRAYATQLTEQQIQELYKTSASVTSNGVVYAYELQEV